MHNHTENVLLFYDCHVTESNLMAILDHPNYNGDRPATFAFCLCFAMLYLVPYLVIGSAVWFSLRKMAWLVQAMLICLSVNIVILSAILLFVNKTMMPSASGPKCLSPLVLIIPVASVVGSLLSAVPISYYCKHYYQELT